MVETAAAIASPADRPSILPRRILVAEDVTANQMILRGLLEIDGHSVTIAANGAEAVAAVRDGGFDLVLMDMQMPVMDGISASIAIRALPGPEHAVSIVALTANALVGQREICLAAGMNSFLTKPVQPDALYAAILHWGHINSDPAAA